MFPANSASLWNSRKSPAVSGITQPTGLIVYYTFDDADTTTTLANDTNPNGSGPHNLTLSGTPDSVSGKILQGRLFSGGTKYGLTGSSFQAPQTALSISCWVAPDNDNGFETIACQVNYPTDLAWALSIWGTDNSPSFTVYTDVNNAIARRCSTSFTGGHVWQHLVGVWDGGSTSAALKIYLNNVRVDDSDFNTNTFTAINSASLVLGIAASSSGGNFYDGYLDDFRLYNRALSAADIAAIYNAGLLGNP